MTENRADAFSLENRVILITGGSSGIGLATARLLLERGSNVVITGRDEDRIAQVVEELKGDFGGASRLLGVRADASSLGDIGSLMDLIRERHGHLDGVFANAGIAIAQRSQEITEEDFDYSVNVNFKGVFFTVQKAVPLLDTVGGGSVVLNSSWVMNRGLAFAAMYSATKAAVHNLCRTLGADLAERGIRVNSVSPGYIDTRMTPAENRDVFRSQVPLRRLGRAEEVAQTVAFLLSEQSSYITAQDIGVDGGLVTAVPAA